MYDAPEDSATKIHTHTLAHWLTGWPRTQKPTRRKNTWMSVRRVCAIQSHHTYMRTCETIYTTKDESERRRKKKKNRKINLHSYGSHTTRHTHTHAHLDSCQTNTNARRIHICVRHRCAALNRAHKRTVSDTRRHVQCSKCLCSATHTATLAHAISFFFFLFIFSITTAAAAAYVVHN